MERLAGSTYGRARLMVGLLLAALFCVQCTQSGAIRAGSPVMDSPAAAAPADRTDLTAELERLAREDHVALILRALAHYRQSCRDYRCEFRKQERINGRLRPEQRIRVKFREEPFSVAMAWTKNAPTGDRVLYVEGANGGQMMVRPKSGLLRALVGGTVLRDPDGKDARAATLRPVTAFGFRRTLEGLLRVYRLAAGRKEGRSSFLGYRDVFGRRVLAVQRILPPRDDYPAARTIWYLDCEHLVPLGISSYDWDDRLIGSYFFKDVEFNVGLAAEDFTGQANQMTSKK